MTMCNMKALILILTHVKYQSFNTHFSKDISKVKFFLKGSRSQGEKSLYPRRGLVTKNTPVKYQRSSTHCSEVISKVEVS